MVISAAKSSLMSNGNSLGNRASNVLWSHICVWNVSGYCLHDCVGALIGIGSLGLVWEGKETSLKKVL